MKRILIFSCVVFFLFSYCQQHTNGELTKHVFADTPVATLVKAGIIDEASGIADSRANSGFLWVEQDSGNPPEISLLAYNGTVSKKIYIKGIVNRDWEDIALAKGPDADGYYIYLAEIGDNSLQYASYYIYRFREPAASADTVFTYDKIAFKYPEGANNAEAIIVDNNSKNIFIITKSETKSNIYKLPYPQNTTGGITEATLVGQLPFAVVVGAGISPDGTEIIIKTYTALNYWKRSAAETIEQVLKSPPTSLTYQLENQGESVCFKNDSSGFYTLSEKPATATPVFLNFYKRN